MKNKKVAFCFPYRGVGGVSNMFGRQANYLAEYTKLKVSIIDFSDGALSNQVSEKVNSIFYENINPVELLDFDYVIFQSMTPWSIYPKINFRSNTCLIFISTLTENFYPFLPGAMRNLIGANKTFRSIIWRTFLSSEFNKSQNFIKQLLSLNSLVFLDGNIAKNTAEDFGVNVENAPIIPLFSDNCSTSPEFLFKKRTSKLPKIKILWIGRLADFKISILNRVLDDLSNIDSIKKDQLSFTIVGSGSYSKRLKIPKEFSADQIIKVKHVKPSNIESIIREHDVVFAMGTAALDAARLGVPVVRLDYSYKFVDKNYRYKFLHQVKGYSLGDKIESRFYDKGGLEIDGIFETLTNDWLKSAQRDYEYYRTNHQIDASIEKLLNTMQVSQYTWSNYKKSSYQTSILFHLKNIIVNRLKAIKC